MLVGRSEKKLENEKEKEKTKRGRMNIFQGLPTNSTMIFEYQSCTKVKG